MADIQTFEKPTKKTENRVHVL